MGSYIFLMVALVFCVGITAYRLVNLTRGIHMLKRNMQQSSHRRRVDITDRSIYLPDQLTRLRNELNSLGFERLGEMEVLEAGADSGIRFWLMVDPPRTTCSVLSLVGQYGAVLEFETEFATKAHIETMGEHPKGAFERAIHEPDLRFVEASSPETSVAYQEHTVHIAQFHQRHGEPVSLGNITDYINCLNESQTRRNRMFEALIKHYRRYQVMMLVAFASVISLLAYSTIQFVQLLPLDRNVVYGLMGIFAVSTIIVILLTLITRNFNRSVTKLGMKS